MRKSYNDLSEIKFCLDMHEIAIATDNLPPRPPNMADVDYDNTADQSFRGSR